MRCDLLILGDTPDAWAAARHAATLGARTIVLRPNRDSRRAATGISAILSAYEESEAKETFLAGRLDANTIRPSDLWHAALAAHERNIAEISREFGIRILNGPFRLKGPRTAEIFAHGTVTRFEAELILIATGTTARRPSGIPARRPTTILPEEIAHCHSVPKRLAVLGGNRTARVCARLYKDAGSQVTMIDTPRSGPSEFDTTLVRDEVVECRNQCRTVSLRMASGRVVDADAILFAAGRAGATGNLGLAAAGLEADDRGGLWCDDLAMTWIPTIAAAGEVIGYPRDLRENRDRIHRTIANHLELNEPCSPSVISIRIEQAQPISEPTTEGRRVRTRARPLPALRVFNG